MAKKISIFDLNIKRLITTTDIFLRQDYYHIYCVKLSGSRLDVTPCKKNHAAHTKKGKCAIITKDLYNDAVFTPDDLYDIICKKLSFKL